MLDDNGNIVNWFTTIEQATKQNNISVISIQKCTSGENKFAFHYTYMYLNKYNSIESKELYFNDYDSNYNVTNETKIVFKYSINNELIETYNSIGEASRTNHIKHDIIKTKCLTNEPYKGYIYSFS